MSTNNLVKYFGSRGDNWPNPPQGLTDMLNAWLELAGVKVPHQFWIESTEPSDEFIPDPLIHCRITNANFFEVRVFVRRDNGCDFWLLHMAWSSGEVMGLNNALLDATAFFAHDPTQPGRRVYNSMLSLYEVLDGKDITPDLVTDDVAKDAFFRESCDLVFGLRFLAKRGYFVQAEEGDTFRWTDSFKQHMATLSEDRCEQLLNLEKITPEKLANSLSDFEGEMLEKLGALPSERHGSELEIRVSNKFLGLTQIVLEEFVGLLAAGGVVIAIADHEKGILGKIWRLDIGRQQQVLSLFKAKWEKPQSPPKPALTRDKQIEASIANSQVLLNFSTEHAAEDRRQLDAVKAEIFELESRLAVLRANQATLQACISNDETTQERARAALAQLEAGKADLAASIAGKADQAIMGIRQKAAELGVDADVLLKVVASKLTDQKLS